MMLNENGRVIEYSALKLNAMSLVADLAGGSGTVFMLVLQKKFRFSVKAGVFYGACMPHTEFVGGNWTVHQCHRLSPRLGNLACTGMELSNCCLGVTFSDYDL